jgi:hypothetical protein
VFRARAKVTDPDGYQWEVCVSRLAAPRWKPASYENDPSLGFGAGSRGGRIDGLLAIPEFLLFEVLWPLVRFLVELPFAAARARHSNTYRVEAHTWFPKHEAYLWTTTADHVDRVTLQIVDGLKLGELARPLGAAFVGTI